MIHRGVLLVDIAVFVRMMEIIHTRSGYVLTHPLLFIYLFYPSIRPLLRTDGSVWIWIDPRLYGYVYCGHMDLVSEWVSCERR